MEHDQQQHLKWLLKMGTGTTEGQAKKLSTFLMMYYYHVKWA